MTPQPFTHPNALKVFGPAGSGKTRTLIEILWDHVSAGDFLLSEGIICSFTRAASYDIARRASGGAAPGRHHTTLHALCKRYYGFDGEAVNKHLRGFFAERHIAYTPSRHDGDEWAPDEEWSKSEGGELMAFIGLCRNRLLTLAEGRALQRPPKGLEHWWDTGALERLYADYTQWKDDHQFFDFTDLLEYAVKHPPQGRWPFFVLDEAQDCTPLQWAVAQLFAARAEVAYIGGDDDQAIYSWAGATPVEFLRAQTTETDILHINHRSAGLIVDESQAFIRQNVERQDKGTRAVRDGGEIGSAAFPVLSSDESTFVMGRAHYLLEPLMQELEVACYPFVDKRGKYGVTGKAAATYERYSRLHRGQALTLGEWRLLADEIPAAPWLTHGTKARLAAIPADQQKALYIRLPDITTYGALVDLQQKIAEGNLSPIYRLDRSRIDYLRGVEAKHGADMLTEAAAAKVCAVGPIHAFKGLECDHAVISESMPPAAIAEAYVDPEPERRVFYVGMTRAKDRITWVPGVAHRNFRMVL